MPTLKGNLVIPIVLCVCFLGAFATRGRLADVIVAAIFGVLGYFMDKYRYLPRQPGDRHGAGDA